MTWSKWMEIGIRLTGIWFLLGAATDCLRVFMTFMGWEDAGYTYLQGFGLQIAFEAGLGIWLAWFPGDVLRFAFRKRLAAEPPGPANPSDLPLAFELAVKMFGLWLAYRGLHQVVILANVALDNFHPRTTRAQAYALLSAFDLSLAWILVARSGDVTRLILRIPAAERKARVRPADSDPA